MSGATTSRKGLRGPAPRLLGRGLLGLAAARLRGSLRVRLALVVALLFVVVAAVAPLLVGPSPGGTLVPLMAPSFVHRHVLGTDLVGRDVGARLILGTRTALFVAFTGVVAMAPVGVLLGALAGFFRGFTDTVVSRLIEALSSFPSLVLVLAVQALVPHPTVGTLLAAIALTRWTDVARLVRAETLRVAATDYVLAARALGAHPSRLLAKHILPNALAPAIVAAAFGFGAIVLVETSLDFLRVGVPSDVSTWGETMSEAREHPEAWWLLAFPGVLVFLIVASMNVVGEALRDALDPKLGERGGAQGETPPR